MAFLVIDDRYGTPIHVFLDDDPRAVEGFPPLAVRRVVLEALADGARRGPFGPGVGQDPRDGDTYREFGSDRAAEGAGFALVEPRYVGASWDRYLSGFRPGGAGRSRARTAGRPVGV